ncbi:MAG: MFS transporter [Tabrizicola sp.]|nr:MFS transporter [Tabrizicola sp.]
MPFLTFMRANAPFLLAGFLLSFLSSFGQTYFLAPFAGDVRADYGLSHGDWGAVYSASTMAAALAMLWAGALTDRFKVRSLGTAVLLGLAAALVAMAANPSLWTLPVVVFGLRFFGQGMVVQAAGVAMSRWFVGSRGRALAISAFGFSIGEILLPLGFTAMKALVPWRMLFLVAAAIVVLLLPVLRHLLRLERTPQQMSAETDAPGIGGRHWTRPEVLRHGLFWACLPVLMSPPLFITTIFFHQVHLAEVKGWSHLGLLAALPFYTVAAAVGMFAGGWALDRVGSARIMPVYTLPLAVFFLLFPHIQSLFWAGPVLILMGLSSGAQMTVPMAFWAEVYGTRHLGAIRAMVAAVLVMSTAIGPALSGWLIDGGVELDRQMPGYAAFALLAAAGAAIGLRRFGATP